MNSLPMREIGYHVEARARIAITITTPGLARAARNAGR
jgi:hypothetical protein